MIYSQNDSRWKNTLLGFNTSSQFTIGTAGCYVTAIANVCDWAGNSLSPQQINDICKQNNWFVDGGEINRDDIPALLCSNLGYVGRTNWSGKVDMNFFNDASDPNVAYIIKIDSSPAPGMQSHFTMVWSKLNANDLEINDSWDGIRKALSHYGDPATVLYSAMKFVRVVAPLPPPVIQTEVHPYTIEAITPKQIQINKATHQWGMTYDNFTAMAANPVRDVAQGEIITVTAICHHNIGYNYYLPNASDPTGFNVLDCDDYTPPPAPYVPPAAPVIAPPAETYVLLVPLPTYADDLGAINRTNGGQTQLPIGTYYVWAKIGNVYQLGVDNVHAPTNNWVNTLDNVKPKPVPAPPVVKSLPSQVPIGTANDNSWKTTYKSFHLDRSADTYIVNQHLTVKEYSGKRKPIIFEKGNPINIVGTFVKNGVTFYRPRSFKDEYFSWYYGISVYDDDGNVNLVKKVETDPEKLEQHISDFVHYWKDDFKQIGTLIWDVLARRKK